MRGSGDMMRLWALHLTVACSLLYVIALFMTAARGQESGWGDATGTDPADIFLEDYGWAADDLGLSGYEYWEVGDWLWFEVWLVYAPVTEPFSTAYTDDRANWELMGVLPPGWETLEDGEDPEQW